MKKKNKIESIDCSEAVARFNDFMDNYLKDRGREELLSHLAICRNCMERFEFEQLLKSKIHQLADSGRHSMKERIEKIISSI